MKINIAISGGPCTGKSTLAAVLFAELKKQGYDYDLVIEVDRRLKKSFGDFRNPFERFFMWRLQEKEELRSTAQDGFITDKPLFHYYVQARQYAVEPRDNLAVEELLDMCLEMKDRYQLIVIAEDQYEISYRNDSSRKSREPVARQRHDLIRSFIDHFWAEKIFTVKGKPEERVAQVIAKLEAIRRMPK